jgi:large subunit ribosomal protein L25
MATTFALQCETRTARGKGAARKVRARKRVPAVLYGRGSEPLLLEVETRSFLRTVSGHTVSNMILDLTLSDAGEVIKVVIREIQLDPIDGSPIHVDFNRISLTERIEFEIPVELTGVPIGVKDFGGILQHPVRSVLVECLPTDVPEVIMLDVSALNIGEAVYVSDVKLPNVIVLTDPETTLASVLAPTVAEEPTEAEAVEGDKEPEVITAKKEEGEDAKGKDKGKG